MSCMLRTFDRPSRFFRVGEYDFHLGPQIIKISIITYYVFSSLEYLNNYQNPLYLGGLDAYGEPAKCYTTPVSCQGLPVFYNKENLNIDHKQYNMSSCSKCFYPKAHYLFFDYILTY